MSTMLDYPCPLSFQLSNLLSSFLYPSFCLTYFMLLRLPYFPVIQFFLPEHILHYYLPYFAVIREGF